MKYFCYLLLSVLLCVGCSQKKKAASVEQPISHEPRVEFGIMVDSLFASDGEIESGESLGTLLSSLGAKNKHIGDLIHVDDSVFNMRNLRAGKSYRAYYRDSARTDLTYLVYIESPIDYVVFHFSDSICVKRGHNQVLKRECVSHATIKSSLWNAIDGAGLNMQLALDLSDIYAWNIDFFGLQTLDSFVVYYDELFVDTTSVGIGTIYAAKFYHNGKDYYAFKYAYDDQQGYWDESGISLKKAFLKAPLQYSRISSGFSYARRHPVYRTVRPHTGVDYAAPMGTPVMSIGDGTVVARGYQGGGGNTVKIRHNSTYTTAYLHLSKYGSGISVGSRVKQGQIIGYVGSTGASTGAHLDFRVWQNGKPINPLKMVSPPVAPIPDEHVATYDSLVRVWRQKIDI